MFRFQCSLPLFSLFFITDHVLPGQLCRVSIYGSEQLLHYRALVCKSVLTVVIKQKKRAEGEANYKIINIVKPFWEKRYRIMLEIITLRKKNKFISIFNFSLDLSFGLTSCCVLRSKRSGGRGNPYFQ